MTPNSVKPLYLIINNANGYIKEYNGNIYLTLAANDESKDMLKKLIKNTKKIKDLIRLLNMNSDNYKSSHPEAFLGKGVLRICRQIYRRTSMPKCDFNKVASKFACKFAAYFQNTFY